MHFLQISYINNLKIRIIFMIMNVKGENSLEEVLYNSGTVWWIENLTNEETNSSLPSLSQNIFLLCEITSQITLRFAFPGIARRTWDKKQGEKMQTRLSRSIYTRCRGKIRCLIVLSRNERIGSYTIFQGYGSGKVLKSVSYVNRNM